MIVSLLHEVCKTACRNAYEAYKQQIQSQLFVVDACYIDTCLAHMREEILTRINKVHFVDPKWPKQYAVKEHIVNQYLATTVAYGQRYAEKFR